MTPADIFLVGLWTVVAVLLGPIMLLPDAVSFPGVASAVTSLGSTLQNLDTLFPIGTLINIVEVFIAIEYAIFVVWLVTWILRRIPTQS